MRCRYILVPHTTWAPFWNEKTGTIKCPSCSKIGTPRFHKEDLYHPPFWFFTCDQSGCLVNGNLDFPMDTWRERLPMNDEQWNELVYELSYESSEWSSIYSDDSIDDF
jgi:hypothetical protein